VRCSKRVAKAAARRRGPLGLIGAAPVLQRNFKGAKVLESFER
jgi:hypothetical protein